VRSLWQFGARICHATVDRQDGGLFVVPPPAATAPVVFVADGDDRFSVRGGAVSPLAIAGLRVTANTAFDRGEVAWCGPHGERLGSAAIGPAATAGAGFAAPVDLGANFAFLNDGTHLGGLRTFVVRLFGNEQPVAATALQSLPPTPGVPLDRPLRGAKLGWADVQHQLPWSSLPADAGAASVVLMGGWQPLRFERVDGQLTSPLPMRLFLDYLRRWIHVDRFYYYLECHQPQGVWRSAIDWFVLDPEQP
jgi:hypothetical protein